MYGRGIVTLECTSYTVCRDGYSRITSVAQAFSSLPFMKLMSTPPTKRNGRGCGLLGLLDEESLVAAIAVSRSWEMMQLALTVSPLECVSCAAENVLMLVGGRGVFSRNDGNGGGGGDDFAVSPDACSSMINDDDIIFAFVAGENKLACCCCCCCDWDDRGWSSSWVFSKREPPPLLLSSSLLLLLPLESSSVKCDGALVVGVGAGVVVVTLSPPCCFAAASTPSSSGASPGAPSPPQSWSCCSSHTVSSISITAWAIRSCSTETAVSWFSIMPDIMHTHTYMEEVE